MERYLYCPKCARDLVCGPKDGRDRYYCPRCGWVNYLNPVPAAACLVRDSSGRVLLVKRDVAPQKGKWSLPAGFIELDETASEAALRELYEETGIRGEIKELIGVYIQPSSRYGAVLTVGYLADEAGGELSAGDDASDVKYEHIEDIDMIPFESHRQMLRDAGI